jgi:hypothetical protein
MENIPSISTDYVVVALTPKFKRARSLPLEESDYELFMLAQEQEAKIKDQEEELFVLSQDQAEEKEDQAEKDQAEEKQEEEQDDNKLFTMAQKQDKPDWSYLT